MKINQAIDALNAGISPVTGSKGEKPGPSGRSAATEASAGASPSACGGLSISPLSSKMQTLESRLASGESFDAARVSVIKAAIRDGSFEVNAVVVADKLLASAYDLFIKRH
jgi:negative regulator of flagellin synthesis FlgM